MVFKNEFKMVKNNLTEKKVPAGGFKPMLRRSGCRALIPLDQAGVNVSVAKWNSDSKPGWMKKFRGRGRIRTHDPASKSVSGISPRPLGYAVQ